MTTTPPSRRWLLWPLLAALATRLACLPLAKVLPPWGDANGYLYLARQFRESGAFGTLPSGVRPPVPRILMALGLDTSAVPAGPFPGVYLVQILAGVLACALLMILARRRFGTRAAMATGWIYALYPPSVLWTAGVLMVEVFAVLASAGALLALDVLDGALRRADEARAPRVWPRALLLGAVLGLGILTKEQMLSVAAVALLVLVLRPGTPLARRVGLALIIGAVTFLVTLPWARHNLETEGAFVPSGSYANLGLMLDNAPPGRSGMRMWVDEPTMAGRLELARETFGRALTEYPGLTAQRGWMRLRIALGPEVMLPIYIAVPFDEMNPTQTENLQLFRDAWTLPSGTWGRRVQWLCAVAAIVLFGLSAAGLAAAPSSVLTRQALIMTGVILLSATLFVAAARYRQSLIAFHLPFAGLALAALTDRQGRAGLDASARRRALAWGLGAAILLTLTVCVLPAPAVPSP